MLITSLSLEIAVRIVLLSISGNPWRQYEERTLVYYLRCIADKTETAGKKVLLVLLRLESDALFLADETESNP